MDVARVYERYDADPSPALAALRTESVRLVPGFGASRPRVLLVGEAPGATENLRGRPFCGASGRVLDDLMAEAGLRLQDLDVPDDQLYPANAYVTNVVKYRPPGNRTPFASEIAVSVPYLREEWNALGCPRVLVAVGSVAALALSPDRKIPQGQFREVREGVWIWHMYHPAYGLRQTSARPTLEAHWEAFGSWLVEKGPDLWGRKRKT